MRYLGNKKRMISNIEKFINDNKINGHIFCDLFSGSGTVADYFKDRYVVITNDILKSSYYFSYAKVHNEKVPEFKKFYNEFGCSIFDHFNKKNYSFSKKHFIYNSYCPHAGRMFFTDEVANKIDGIRLEIDELFRDNVIDESERIFLIASLLETIMRYSNTSGTYEAYLKNWDSRSLKPFILKPLCIYEKSLFSKENKCYNEDANTLIKKISGDILYLDTPYTITDYFSAYHILETVAKYDKPEIKGITGRRVNKPAKSDYSISSKALNAYENLIKNSKFRSIIISYSTQSLISIDDLLKMLSKYSDGEIVIKKYPFREYKNIRSAKKEHKLEEVLIYFKRKKTDD